MNNATLYTIRRQQPVLFFLLFYLSVSLVFLYLITAAHRIKNSVFSLLILICNNSYWFVEELKRKKSLAHYRIRLMLEIHTIHKKSSAYTSHLFALEYKDSANILLRTYFDLFFAFCFSQWMKLMQWIETKLR